MVGSEREATARADMATGDLLRAQHQAFLDVCALRRVRFLQAVAAAGTFCRQNNLLGLTASEKARSPIAPIERSEVDRGLAAIPTLPTGSKDISLEWLERMLPQGPEQAPGDVEAEHEAEAG
jgi:hypothetical protein